MPRRTTPGHHPARAVIADRDLGFAEPLLPVVGWLVDRWFRPEVDGWEHVPDAGPVLFVGNHSGGPGSPDSVVFILSFIGRYGSGRPLFWLAHSMLMATPGLGNFLRRCGVVSASPEEASAILRAGAALVVYPGGDIELHRPWWQRDEVKFMGRTGFARLARETGAPLVPVVAHGVHRSYLPLTDGRAIARRLGLDRRFNLRTMPVSLALPWVVNVGPVLPNLPLPVKVRIRILEPVDVAGRFSDDQSAYDHVTSVMQQTLDDLARA